MSTSMVQFVLYSHALSSRGLDPIHEGNRAHAPLDTSPAVMQDMRQHSCHHDVADTNETGAESR